MKYIFVTGGVCSSLGKGVACASLGTLLESCGLNVSFRKFDGYLNINAGTMNPEEHGEVYVADDGTETDLDLGHYYRFTNAELNKHTSITAGAIYKGVIENEEKGLYDGECCQVIPHVTNEIKKRLIENHPPKTDVVIVEIGGTVGDVENQIAIQAIRQIRSEEKPENTCFIHMVHITRMKAAKEWKTKPAQQSCALLMGMGIIPDMLFCRIETGRVVNDIKDKIIKKISDFCNVGKEDIFLMDDVRSVYEIPSHHWEMLPDRILNHLNINDNYYITRDEIYVDKSYKNEINNTNADWKNFYNYEFNRDESWRDRIKSINFNSEKKIKIGIFGKYTNVQDSYKSIKESLEITSFHLGCLIDVYYYSEMCTPDIDGIIIPGGFGKRGVDVKQEAFLYSIEKSKPCLGLCLGFQTSLIAYAREYCGIKDAWHQEWEHDKEDNKSYIFHLMESQKKINRRSGTMRLGEYVSDVINKDSEFYNIYKAFGTGPNKMTYRNCYDEEVDKYPLIFERHRHRYEFNNEYKNILENNGVVFTASSYDNNLMEACEIIDKKQKTWFIGTQYHPEYKSKFLHPHPLFMALIKKCLK